MSNNGSQMSTDDANSVVISDQLKRYMENKINRSDFPSDFIFGAGTSAYQVEGAWATGGKGPSNWDVWCMKKPGNVDGGNNGCVAIDQYNLCKEDVALLKKTGFDSYRFSISWTRVLPGGTLSAGINRDGIKYYNDIIDMLLAEDIKPCVTIFHWDIPQCLEDEYGGFLSPRIVRDYCDFAELCFWEFGDRVKYWTTINEAWSYSVSGYVTAIFPPGRGGTTPAPISAIPRHRYRQRDQSTVAAGNPGTEPYIVGHHLLLAHAAVVDIYRTRFQALQGGKIGMVNVTMWWEAYSDTPEDNQAILRAFDFMFGWFVSPLVFGDYPEVMRQNVGARLPTFTPEQAKLVKGSFDFLGVNYYTSNYVYDYTPTASDPISYETDQHLKMTGYDKNNNPIGPVPSQNANWLFIYPIGIYKLLTHIKGAYNNPIIYITENGVAEDNNTALTVSQARFDWTRIQAYQEHFAYVKTAIDDAGVNVKGFYMWAMFDNFEWASAYSVRFGTFFIDYVNGRLTRIPKVSAMWFTNFLNNTLPSSKKQAKENEGQTVSAKRTRRN